MLAFLRDKLATYRLQARYQRLIQERILHLAEATGPQPVSPDPGEWWPLGGGRLNACERRDVREQTRRLVAENPHARNVLRLLEIYVTGPGLRANAVAVSAEDSGLARKADHIWSNFLQANRRHYSFREHARRTWRDGECFLRLFGQSALTDGPRVPRVENFGSRSEQSPAEPAILPTVRFVDPETIGETATHLGTQGILTEPEDIETPLAYLRIDPANGTLAEEIPADEMLHTRKNVDSNERRGVSGFAALIEPLSKFERWLDTELTARKLQASIVLWRKVQGAPSRATAVADAAQTGTSLDPAGNWRSERYRAGTILTTSHGTELQYLQPNTNFGDAVPLGRLLLLCTAAGAGLPEFMLTSDAANANFASTMVAEGPAVKLFQAEQQFFAGEFEQLWWWVLAQAVLHGELPPDALQRLRCEWTFPQLVARDRNRDRLADVKLADARILSRAEVARRDGTDPATMRTEIAQQD